MDSKNVKRISLGLAFFLSGLSFATWASRIPTIKDIFTLNQAELGNILMVLPISSLIGLPISGWLVSKHESRIPLFFSTILSTVSLVCVAYSKSLFFLIVAVAIFAFFLRIQIIAINTQAIILQKSYKKNINGSFHGLWSTGGVFGILLSTLMIKQDVSIELHFLVIGGFIMVGIFFSYPFLLSKDRASEGNKLKFGKPDTLIFFWGCLLF